MCTLQQFHLYIEYFCPFLLELNGDQQVELLSTDYATPDGHTVWQTVYSGK